MNTNRFLKSFSFFALLAALFNVSSSGLALAQDRTGNGGLAVVCYDRITGVMVSAQLLDLFEGEMLHGRKYQHQGMGHGALIALALVKDRMKSNAVFLAEYEKAFARANGSQYLLPIGHGLQIVTRDDALPVFIRRGCKLESMAIFLDEKVAQTTGMFDREKLIIDQEVFYRVRPIDRAALFVHEAIYLMAREKLGDTNSVRARLLTAHLFSTNFDAETTQKLMNEFVRP